jgi:3-dehydrotetronate 4-kinase
MLLGAIADDFTGASDLANTLTRQGMRTVQTVGIPASAPLDADACVVSLKSRSIPADEAVLQSLQACRWLRARGARQIVFKYCSTFDSTPEGNIGPVAAALLRELDAPVAVVCPAFPVNGRTIYQGHLFVGDRLLSESGMERHPLNPMTDSDLRRWLGHQTRLPVGHAPLSVVAQGAAAVGDALAREAAAGRRLVVVDAVADEDLFAIGAAVAGHALVTGGSGIALGLPQNFVREGLIRLAPSSSQQIAGAGVVLSGSCSTATREQVEAYLRDHPGFAVDPEFVLGEETTADGILETLLPRLAERPIVYSTMAPRRVAEIQERFGRETVAHALESLFGKLAEGLAAAGVRRLVVGGGETAGAVVQALGVDQMAIGPEIDPGVPALYARSRRGTIGLALKSGNFGSTDFYAKALGMLARGGD